jgi:hypothetical protein
MQIIKRGCRRAIVQYSRLNGATLDHYNQKDLLGYRIKVPGLSIEKQIERPTIFRLRISLSTVSHTKIELLETPIHLRYAPIRGLKVK